MLGRSHALSGALTVLVVAPLAHLAAVPTLEVAVLAAGASLLPDLDHRDSTVAHAGGLVTRVGAAGIQAVAGHRGALHSPLVAAVVGGAVVLTATASPDAAAGLAGLVVGLGVLGLAHGPHRRSWALLGALTATAVWLLGVALPVWLMAVAVSGGMAVHILGDGLTRGGVPLLWPISRRRFSLPLLGRTGSLRESIGRWGMAAGVVVLAAQVVAAVVH